MLLTSQWFLPSRGLCRFFLSSLLSFLSFYLGIAHFLKRKSLLRLLNSCSEFLIDDESFKTFEVKLRRNTIVISGYISAVFVTHFVVFTRRTLLSAFLCYLQTYPYVTILGFMCVVKAMETYIIILLNCLTRQLEQFLENSSFNLEEYKSLVEKCTKIVKLNNEFNIAFGNQLTVAVCCLTTNMTFQVILIFFIFLIYLLSIVFFTFQLFQGLQNIISLQTFGFTLTTLIAPIPYLCSITFYFMTSGDNFKRFKKNYLETISRKNNLAAEVICF